MKSSVVSIAEPSILDDVVSGGAGSKRPGDVEKSTTEELNEEQAMVLHEGSDYIVLLEDFTFSSVRAMRNYLANRLAYDKHGDPIGRKKNGGFVHLNALDVWLRSPERLTYRGVVFDPEEKQKPHELNLWRGRSVEPAPGCFDLIHEHIFSIWCREDVAVFTYVISWLARMVQKPWLQGQSIITLKSDEGAGKGVITDMFVDIFRHHSLVATHPRDITGRFNDRLATSIFVLINEAVWGGSKEEEGVLKTLATDKLLTIEKKFVQKFTVRNCTHIIISSNNDWYAPLDKTDRRYLTLTLDDSVCGDHAYFNALIAEIENGGREAFLNYLLEFDISDFEPKIIPKANRQERARLKTEGLNSIEKWMIDLVDGGELPMWAEEEYTFDDGRDRWRVAAAQVPCKLLLADYVRYAKTRGYHVKTDTAVGLFLKETMQAKRVRSSNQGERRWVYRLPSVEESRQLLTDHLGGDSPFSCDVAET